MLRRRVSVSISVYVPSNAFANWLCFDFDVANADVIYAGYNNIPGYVSLNGFNSYVTAYSGGPGGQTNLSVPMPACIADDAQEELDYYMRIEILYHERLDDLGLSEIYKK